MSTEQDYRVASILDRLDKLLELGPNWDSYGAPPTHPGATLAVRRFVEATRDDLPPGAHVVPMSSGSVQLEWYRGKKILELEFDEEGTITYLQWHPQTDDVGIEKEGVISTDGVGELFRWLES